MMSRILLLFVFILASTFGFSQNNYEIKFEFENYDNDTLLLAYFYADRQLIQDTVFADENRQFSYSGEDTLAGGVYILMFYPKMDYIQFLVNENEAYFTIKGDYNDLQKPSFEGSQDNELFYDYLANIGNLRREADKLHAKRKEAVANKQDTTQIDDQLLNMDLAVLSYQDSLIANYPESMTALLIKGNKDINIPEFEESGEALQKRRFYYYREHFFDNIDLGDPRVLRTSFLNNKLNRYLDKLTVQMPDSAIVAVDYLLEQMEPSIDTWKFYVAQFLNKYAKMQIIGMDAVYVHMVDKYYATGRTPWADEETLGKILDNANKLKPVLLGKIAPDVTLFTEDETPISLHEIESPYTVLIFWAPDCGHCKKSMEHVIAFNEKFKSQGVKTIGICTKHMDKTDSCWEFVKEKNMEGLAYNLADRYHRSRFQVKYNVKTTPQVFILDKDKKILIKKIAAEKLEEIMADIIKLEEQNQE